ncbi:50S ribosomal protein L10 [Candidatus Pacearchaeota archaeon]|nr:50S ribosomal protein L10 [Candidatus Pacearchaeota archaeon]
MDKTREKPIPKKKTRAVDELVELASTKRTILIASTKNLPDSQFQDIRKKLRGKVIIKVPKKSIMFRAIEKIEKGAIKHLKEQITGDIAIIFSDLDAFDVATELVKNKVAAKAKIGQEAPTDIEIEVGPTDLVPGPAISELGSLGIQIEIKEGKIHIRKPKVIAKKGEKISEGAAGIMNKLDIKPFTVGFEPLVAFDTKEEKMYLNIKIDPQGTIAELKYAFNRALAFVVSIGYANEDTIKFLISKASSHEKALSNLININVDKVSGSEGSNKADNTQNEESKLKNGGENG